MLVGAPGHPQGVLHSMSMSYLTLLLLYSEALDWIACASLSGSVIGAEMVHALHGSTASPSSLTGGYFPAHIPEYNVVARLVISQTGRTFREERAQALYEPNISDVTGSVDGTRGRVCGQEQRGATLVPVSERCG
jgi:hypothetical protein